MNNPVVVLILVFVAFVVTGPTAAMQSKEVPPAHRYVLALPMHPATARAIHRGSSASLR